MSERKATLSIDGKDETLELDILAGTIGPDVIDVGKLTSQGYFTYDPGFVSTASCESKITYIDGDKGVLLHRGYPIEQLAEQSDYLETCYLLFHGELPAAPSLATGTSAQPTATDLTSETVPGSIDSEEEEQQLAASRVAQASERDGLVPRRLRQLFRRPFRSEYFRRHPCPLADDRGGAICDIVRRVECGSFFSNEIGAGANDSDDEREHVPRS